MPQFDRDSSEYQLITYSGPKTKPSNKTAFSEHAKGIGNGRAGKAGVFDELKQQLPRDAQGVHLNIKPKSIDAEPS